MSTFTLISSQIVTFFLLIAVGFVATRLKIITDAGKQVLSKLFTYILLPAYFIATLLGTFTLDDLIHAAPLLAICSSVYIIWGVLFAVFARLLRLPKKRRPVYQAIFGFINLPGIGYLLIQSLHPSVTDAFIPVICLVDTIAVFTYGVWLTTDPEKTGHKATFDWKMMINPSLVSVVIVLIMTLAKIPMPSLLMKTFTALSNASNPVCMFFLGALLASTHFKKMFLYKEFYLGILVKIVFVILVIAPIIKSLGLSLEMTNVSIILYSLPTMSMLPVLVAENGIEGEYATGGTLTTILMSIVVIPIVAYFTLL